MSDSDINSQRAAIFTQAYCLSMREILAGIEGALGVDDIVDIASLGSTRIARRAVEDFDRFFGHGEQDAVRTTDRD